MPLSPIESSDWSVDRSSYRSTFARLWACAVLGLVGCNQASQVPEAGALLLQVAVTPGAVTPDELRLSVYDDSGVLWSNVRLPTEGALKPESRERLGTILIQPGPTDGRLRVHARGFTQGTRALDATLVVPPGERSRGTFNLTLDAAVPPDLDDDGVPDDIDDCPAEPNPNQGGCPSGVPQDRDAGMLADAFSTVDATGKPDGVGTPDAVREGPADTAIDAIADTNPVDGRDDDGTARPDVQPDACDGSTCKKPLGVACASESECGSSFCVDSVCCSNACLGPCRSCNQPNLDGLCRAHPLGSNPEGECLAGASCNGVGACGPPPAGAKQKGQLCASANECLSGFCTDGVCCGSACTAACQTCATGTCRPVLRKEDIPECTAPRTCNLLGMCG